MNSIRARAMPTPQNVILIGMPGVGKTTVGECLAQLLQLSFVDVDHVIEAGEGRPLQQILDTDGAEAFCAMEGRYGMSLAVERHIIGTGGSMVYHDAAMQHLRAMGLVVWLDVPVNVLLGRLSNLASRGTVRAPGQTVEDLYRERSVLYARYADIRIEGVGLSPEETARRVMMKLALRENISLDMEAALNTNIDRDAGRHNNGDVTSKKII